ncbi:cellulose-binding protein [Armillaria luteobubalina]|uniref:Cellulose-binding protein n=1 Tax=Armillaria luteobubalina TaxID=153913 RepID=A0AA39QN61_9AGAR|nr:cellulose-binding protein [Armillaria luteobubalina]
MFLNTLALCFVLCGALVRSQSVTNASVLEYFPTKPRVFVLTDIANEPDDEMSLTRFLLYANHFSIQGIAATTSTWLRNQTFAWQIQDKVLEWGEVRDNLAKHAEGWPEAEDLLGRVYSGLPVYGLEGVGEGKDSNASVALVMAVDEASADDPLWVPIWGGASVLAQALWTVQETRTQVAAASFVAKLRVYAISDQDDAGPWIRSRFPDLFYIASIHAFSLYRLAAWTGISGETYYDFDLGGPDSSLVTNDWLESNIRSSGSIFAATYPRFAFIMEGDTPSFLNLIQNGLSARDHPNWGGWGGRYGRTTNRSNQWVDSLAWEVPGADGRNYTSNQATIWQWRKAYQYDFAGRMNWTATADFGAVNHNPRLYINGTGGSEYLYIEVDPGTSIVLDARESFDPDVGDQVVYTWSQDFGASLTGIGDNQAPVLEIEVGEESKLVTVVIPSEDTLRNNGYWSLWRLMEGGLVHVLLEAWDDGLPSLVSYRRVVLKIRGFD